LLEPYAMKVARTVLRRGKPARAYLFQLDTLVIQTINYESRHESVSFYLGSTIARLKLKGFDGDLYKRWNMWLNTKLHA